MARHLARCADARGSVSNLPTVLASYAQAEHVSVQTGWRDLKRLVECGLVRQVQAAAPGFPARYLLSAPTAAIPDDLPASLARAIGHTHTPADPATSPPAGKDLDQQNDEHGHEGVGEWPAGGLCGGVLDTSPLPRKGSPPSPHTTHPGRNIRRHSAPVWGASSSEKDQAWAVLAACGPLWRAQRGPAGVPAADQLAHIAAMTALALRYLPPGEVIELLAEQVASAIDLPTVLAWRLGRVLRAARRRTHVAADEHGHRYAAWRAARANHRPGPAGQAAITTARAAVHAAQARQAAATGR